MKIIFQKWIYVKPKILTKFDIIPGGTLLKSKLRVLNFVFLDLLGVFGTSVLSLIGSSSDFILVSLPLSTLQLVLCALFIIIEDIYLTNIFPLFPFFIRFLLLSIHLHHYFYFSISNISVILC